MFDWLEAAAAAYVGSKICYQIFVLDLASTLNFADQDPDEFLHTHILGGAGVQCKIWA